MVCIVFYQALQDPPVLAGSLVYGPLIGQLGFLQAAYVIYTHQYWQKYLTLALTLN